MSPFKPTFPGPPDGTRVYTGPMERIELPDAPKPEELEGWLDAAEQDASVPLPWTRLLHFASTRGDWDDPEPILWVDALAEWVELQHGSMETDRSELIGAVRDCVRTLASLPMLHLETKWLRQTPREDAAFIYTGSLAEVIEADSLEDAALRLSRLLRTVGSYDYARELLRDAAAWDLGDAAFVSLRLAHAAGRRAPWIDEDPAERERARAVLLRWLGHLLRRRPRLPGRPPRGAVPDVAVSERVAARLEDPRPISYREVAVLATVGRALEDTRVMGASLWAAIRERWEASSWQSASVGSAPLSGMPPATETAPTTERARTTEGASMTARSAVDLPRRSPLLEADLTWIERRLSAPTALRLRERIRDEASDA